MRVILASVIVPIVVSVGASTTTWWLVERPSDEEEKSRVRAVTALSELRAAIDAFKEEKPSVPVPMRTIRGLRDGRHFLFEERYDAATDRFEEALAALEEACPSCPSILPFPDLGG